MTRPLAVDSYGRGLGLGHGGGGVPSSAEYGSVGFTLGFDPNAPATQPRTTNSSKILSSMDMSVTSRRGMRLGPS